VISSRFADDALELFVLEPFRDLRKVLALTGSVSGESRSAGMQKAREPEGGKKQVPRRGLLGMTTEGRQRRDPSGSRAQQTALLRGRRGRWQDALPSSGRAGGTKWAGSRPEGRRYKGRPLDCARAYAEGCHGDRASVRRARSSENASTACRRCCPPGKAAGNAPCGTQRCVAPAALGNLGCRVVRADARG